MKFANPAPLGLFGFATTTMLLSLLNAGWFPLVQNLPLMMATAFAFGGVAQFLAGLLEYPRGNTFGFVGFTSYGAFLFAFGGVPSFLAGLLEYPRGNTFGFVAFTSYGAFWFAFALYIEALPHGSLE